MCPTTRDQGWKRQIGSRGRVLGFSVCGLGYRVGSSPYVVLVGDDQCAKVI